MPNLICNRCGDIVKDDSNTFCWYCQRPLCFHCWENYGNCKHEVIDESRPFPRYGQQTSKLFYNLSKMFKDKEEKHD